MSNYAAGTALELQDLIMGTESVEDFLDRLAEFSASTLSHSIGQDVECGVALQRRKKVMTVAGSSNRAVMLDRIEHGYGEGPCIESMRTKAVMLLGDVGTDPRWPEYQAMLAEHDCRSTLGIPMEIGEGSSAALNFFAFSPGVFSQDVVAEAAGFADIAGRALSLAVRIGTAQSRAEDLKAAMEHRTSIDLACGVVMAQNRCSQEDAMRILTRVSSNRNQKLRVVAAEILKSVTGEEVRTHFDG